MRTRTWLIGGLVALNVVLAGTLVSRALPGARGSFESAAYAQVRSRLDPISAVGQQNGQQIHFIMDVNTGRLAALRFDVQKKEVVPVASTNFEDDAKRAFR